MINTKSNTILVLPSWYPNKLSLFDGDFVQRHVQAISLYSSQYVIYVVKDEKGIITNDSKVEKYETANCTEVIIYYKSIITGISFIDKLLSQKKYIHLYKKAIKEFVTNAGIPRLTHLHVAFKAGILAMWVKRKWGVPFIITEHWTGYHKKAVPNIFINNKLRYLYTKNIFKQGSLLVPVSKNLGEAIAENFPSINYKVIPNVVDINYFKYQESCNTVFTFSHISTMAFQKNVEGIIEAHLLLLNKGIKFKLNLIGNKPTHLVELIEHKGLTNYIFFEESITYTKVAEALQQSNALVMFSRFENLPCVILESLCCGTPVISTTLGGIAEVINDSNGFLINDNIDELATAMESMITNYAKYNREQIAQNAQTKFSYNVIGKAYCDLYHEYFPQ